jgi:class 3 adenylate cyclase
MARISRIGIRRFDTRSPQPCPSVQSVVRLSVINPQEEQVRRVRRSDAVLLVALMAVWGVCAVLHVKQIIGGQLAWVRVYVATPAADDFPTVRGFWPGAAQDASGGLAVGDQIVSVGGVDLRGVGPFGFAAHVYAAAAERDALRVPVSYTRGGTIGDATIELAPVAFPWRMLPLSCSMVVTGALVLARRSGTRIGRAFFFLAIAYGLHWTFFFGGPPVQTYAWIVVFFCASLVMLPLILRAVLIFPAETAPPDGRIPRWPWLFGLFGPISLSWIYGVPLPPEVGFRAVFVINVAFITALLAVVTRNFRRANASGRRQLKWVVLGTYLGTAPVLLADLAAAIAPPLWWLHEAAAVAEIAIPLCVLIAIVRSNFLDVDRLITATAVYSVLSVLVVAALFTAVPQIARAASAATDLDPSTVQLALSVIVAMCIVPGQRWLRPRVERLLFRERHALRAGVENLLRDLAAAIGPDQLLALVGERLDILVRPRACLVYAAFGERFAPVFVRGLESDEVPPSLSADAAPLVALRHRTAPLQMSRWAAAGGQTLPHGERLALERLHAALLLPVRRGAALAGVICLGSKRSGDIYTETDLALLAAVADKVSGELLRFDAAVTLRQERRRSAALGRYVPQPVVARLARGQSLEGGKRDVSVLFVDIRGYTAYSEAQAVERVFSLVNRYTEAVSAVIQRRGGTVVEFLGDGLMAVFGAPEAMPDHARVSVQAACEVVATVRGLALGATDTDAPIAVGIGIASGRAFVGNVRTSDRFVYTAVGDVVNLASRIQGLTRELQAAVAIDARTQRAAGKWAARFKRHERVRIRGRSEPVDIYALPAAAA